MVCKKCGKEVRDTAKFCSGCGSKIEKVIFCEECGAENTTDAIYCEECGNRLVQENCVSNEKNTDEEYDADDVQEQYEEDEMFQCFLSAQESFNKREWTLAYTKFEEYLADEASEDDEELANLACFYLAQMEIVEYWNKKFPFSRHRLNSLLKRGYEKKSILSLLQIIYLVCYEKEKIDENLVKEVYENRHKWKRDFLFEIKDSFSDFHGCWENAIGYAYDEGWTFFETFIFFKVLVDLLDLEEREDAIGEFFAELMENVYEILDNTLEKEDEDDVKEKMDFINSYFGNVLTKYKVIEEEDEELAGELERNMVRYVKEHEDWVYYMMMAEAYDAGCFGDDDDERNHYYCLAGDIGLPQAMMKYFEEMDYEDLSKEAKAQAKKWEKAGYPYAMKFYKAVFDDEEIRRVPRIIRI